MTQNILKGIKRIGNAFCTMYKDYENLYARGYEQGIRRAMLMRKNAIGRQISVFSSVGEQMTNSLTRDARNLRQLPSDVKVAWSAAENITQKPAKVYQSGIKHHLPALLSSIGFLVPIPGAQPAGYILGQILTRLT